MAATNHECLSAASALRRFSGFYYYYYYYYYYIYIYIYIYGCNEPRVLECCPRAETLLWIEA